MVISVIRYSSLVIEDWSLPLVALLINGLEEALDVFVLLLRRQGSVHQPSGVGLRMAKRAEHLEGLGDDVRFDVSFPGFFAG